MIKILFDVLMLMLAVVLCAYDVFTHDYRWAALWAVIVFVDAYILRRDLEEL